MRQLLHTGSISPFSRWHHEHVPHDRGLTDIDGFSIDHTQILEHRTGGYEGSSEDNGGLRAIRRLAAVLGLNWPQTVRRYRWCDVDTRHLLWLAYRRDTEHSPARMLGVFETVENASPVHECYRVGALIADPLFALCEQRGIPTRSFVVLPDGSPKAVGDQLWLVQLTEWVEGRP